MPELIEVRWKSESVFCIEHGKMVILEKDPCFGHEEMIEPETRWDMPNYEFCKLPSGYAFCQPPESLFESILAADEENIWELWCEESQPSDEEILISDLDAIGLREELEQS